MIWQLLKVGIFCLPFVYLVILPGYVVIVSFGGVQSPLSRQRVNEKVLVIPSLMAAWIFLTWSLLIEQVLSHSESLSLPTASLFEYLFVTASFLIAPFIGASSTLRLMKSGAGKDFSPVRGYSLLIFFALVFFIANGIGWTVFKSMWELGLGRLSLNP